MAARWRMPLLQKCLAALEATACSILATPKCTCTGAGGNACSLPQPHPPLQFMKVALKTMKPIPNLGTMRVRLRKDGTICNTATNAVLWKVQACWHAGGGLRLLLMPASLPARRAARMQAPEPACAPAPPQGCVAYIATSQLWVGVVLPLLLSVRRESAAAARFARENGVPPTDRRRRAYTWLQRATTVGTPASAALAAGLVGAYAVWAAAAWAYLGRVYG